VVVVKSDLLRTETCGFLAGQNCQTYILEHEAAAP
jgi:hypothetical protein